MERTGNRMSSEAVLITDMAVLVAIFGLGLLAKIISKRGGNGGPR